MKRVVVGVLLLTALALARQLSEGPFEFTVPAGWTVQSHPQLRFQLALGPGKHKERPTINILPDSSPLSISKYCQQNEELLAKQIKAVKIKGKSYFTTAKGVRGVKLIVRAGELIQVFYLFPGKGDAKYVVTCTTPTSQAAKWMPQFDKSMKTFVVK